MAPGDRGVKPSWRAAPAGGDWNQCGQLGDRVPQAKIVWKKGAAFVGFGGMEDGNDKRMYDAFVQTRSLSLPELGRALLRHNEKLLTLVAGAEGWSPQKMAAMRAGFGDLSACYLVDDSEERLSVLTRNPIELQMIMRTEQMLTLLDALGGKPN